LLRQYKDTCGLLNLSEAVEKLISHNLPLEEAELEEAKQPTSQYAIEDNLEIFSSQTPKSPYAIEDAFSIPNLKHPRLSSLRETMTPVVEKMKKGQSILVRTDKERQRFADIMNSLKRKYATREIKQNGTKAYRCWAV
jgi:ERCC4-related helicase